MENMKQQTLAGDEVTQILAVNAARKGFRVNNLEESQAIRVKVGSAPGQSDVTEIQLISFSKVPGSGSFKLEFEGIKTASIAFDDADSDIQTALQAIPQLASVTVDGDFTDGFQVTMTDAPFPNSRLRVVENTLGTAKVSTIQDIAFSATPEIGTWKVILKHLTKGILYECETLQLPFNISSANLQTALRNLLADYALTVTGSVSTGFAVTFGHNLWGKMLMSFESKLNAYTNEVQTITPDGAAASGGFKFSYKGQETAEIAFGANAGAIQTALRTLPGLSTVTSSGTLATAIVVTFEGVTEPVDLLEIVDNTLETSEADPVVLDAEVTTPGEMGAAISITATHDPLGSDPEAVTASVSIKTAGESSTDGYTIAGGETLDLSDSLDTNAIFALSETQSAEIQVVECF